MSEYTGDNQPNVRGSNREKIYTRWGQLKAERASWLAHWKEISDYLLPRSGRFFIQDRDKGWRRHNSIYDSTGTRSLRILAAGMMSGMTSPARPWFRLTTAIPEIDSQGDVKVWLAQCQKIMLDIFARSNTYRSLHSMYEEIAAFGTGASIILPDFDNVVHHYPLTTGEYCIATNYKGEVDTLYREFQKTVHEVVEEFGYENCSNSTKSLYDRGSLDAWITIVHAIEPRSARDPSKSDSKNMPWKSCYFELNGERSQYLRESGFKKFPAVCPRWSTTGGDIYGNSPGMEALGDIKQLQHEQLRKAQAIDFKTKPPLQVPTSMKNRDVETLPGGISFVDMNSPSGGIKTAFEVNLDLSHLLADIGDVRERIRGSFYADLFLMLANQNNSNMTATEVAERHEEKLLMLGPVLERLQNELLDPLIEITFDQMMEAGIVPPPPQVLQGVNLNVEYVSMLAQAQRAVGTNSIDRFMGTLGQVAQYKPEVLDKVNADIWADQYADLLGVDPDILVQADQVAAIRQQRAQAQQQAAQMEQLNQASTAAKNLGQTPTGNQSALTDVMNMFSGYNSPSPSQV
jgi:hypothetical protein